ncbi:hypothetical protein LRD69_25335 [Streptomyces sp. JH14]|uniref:hypothetical protein n=1 Tax=Streptomyces sp. JH14 TaxID=2793630 RepID=UPI0023F8D20D|nr:hypothetical protein [Streptomyces sp. JH14]MDF6045413.1 hypothetical protein [Streptomyces sp. JH14]
MSSPADESGGTSVCGQRALNPEEFDPSHGLFLVGYRGDDTHPAEVSRLPVVSADELDGSLTRLAAAVA